MTDESQAEHYYRMQVKFMKAIGVAVLLLLFAGVAIAQDYSVLACSAPWGSSNNCGGCDGRTWQAPSADVRVRTDASDHWQRLGDAPATAKVWSATGKTNGTTAVCSEGSFARTVAELLGSQPAPTPTPTPEPAPTPTPEPPSDPNWRGDAELVWTAPTQNTDGTPLTDLAGYTVYFGQDSAALDRSFRIENPEVTSITLNDLTPGVWFFSLTSRNTAGQEGQRTNLVSKTLTAPPAPTPAPQPEPTPEPEPEPTPTPPPAERWVVAPVASGTRPAYEPVRNLDGNAWVRGGEQGRVEVGVECGDEVFRVGSNSYRLVSAVTLASPSYSGRDNVAICVRQ